MAKLTEPKHWNYSAYQPPPIAHFEQMAQAADGWIPIARRHIPDDFDFIELGCAPGYCSAAVSHGKRLRMHGIDFSESAETYLQTLKATGHPEAELIRQDLLNCQLDRTFDVVGSFGLIEHFSGPELGKILALHDKLLKPGGTLIIEVPNFNGFQGLWHRVFDKPSYLLHNVGVMQPGTFDYFTDKGYQMKVCDYVGRLEVWGDTGAYTANRLSAAMARGLERRINRFSAKLEKKGRPLKGRTYSPALIFIATKPQR